MRGGAKNRLVKTDGDGLLAESGITLDANNNLSGMGTIGCGAITQNDVLLSNTYHPLTVVGIAQNNLIKAGSAGIVTGEYAKFTATGLESRTAQELSDELNPMTAQGDVLYGGASGTGTRLAKGDATQVLTMNAGATAPEWATPAGGGYNPVPVCTSYGTEKLTSTGSGSNQACDWVWLVTPNGGIAYPFFLIADSGPADVNDMMMPLQTIIGPFSVTNTDEVHIYLPSGSVSILWGAE